MEPPPQLDATCSVTETILKPAEVATNCPYIDHPKRDPPLCKHTTTGVIRAVTHCGNGIANDGALTTSDGCNMICAGSNDYLCGGGNRLTVYQRDTAPIVQSTTTTTTTTSTSTSTPATTSTTTSTSTTNSAAPPSASAWTSVGCYTDAIGTRTLSVPMGIAGMTPEKCQAACQAANYVFAGVEYG
ncbi:hypothetical protein FRB91_010104 [Serendipita sp. 411]|nr:hypothetical protein FRB91_010104 [Serendipita sp. 411]